MLNCLARVNHTPHKKSGARKCKKHTDYPWRFPIRHRVSSVHRSRVNVWLGLQAPLKVGSCFKKSTSSCTKSRLAKGCFIGWYHLVADYNYLGVPLSPHRHLREFNGSWRRAPWFRDQSSVASCWEGSPVSTFQQVSALIGGSFQ